MEKSSSSLNADFVVLCHNGFAGELLIFVSRAMLDNVKEKD
jgi:hypothetical protein